MKRAFVLFLCLVFLVTSFSVPRFAHADSSTGGIRFNTPSTFCYIGETLDIEVNDPDLNTSPTSKDNVTVTVSSTSLAEGGGFETIVVNLLETEENSSIFTGSVKISNATNQSAAPAEIKGELDGTITAEYDDSGSTKSAVITVSNVMLQGTVRYADEGNTLATYGIISVEQMIDQYTSEYKGVYQINYTDGTYQIPRLPAGTYHLMANQAENAGFLGSKWAEIIVDADGNCSNSDNPVLTTMDFVFQKVQLAGTIADKTGGVPQNSDYFIEVRSENPQGSDFYWSSNEGNYRVAGLSDGNYVVKAVSRMLDNADSNRVSFTIENGLVKEPAPSFNLQFTEPQVSGVVEYSDTQDIVPYTNVDIFDAGMNYLWSTQTDSNGNFNIGGLAPGNYKISAFSNANQDYEPMNTLDIEINGTSITGVVLYLEKKVLKLKWVEDFVLHYNEIGIRLDNISKLSDARNLTATITGNNLTDPIILHDPRVNNIGNDEGEFYFTVDDTVRQLLTFGKYAVAVKNGEDLILDVDTKSSELDIIQQLYVIPYAAELSQYQSVGASFGLDAEEYNNGKLYPWKSGDVLTVNIYRSDNGRTFEDTVTVNAPSDTILPITIPAQAGTVEGNRYLEVYNGDQLIARGDFEVGNSSIDGAMAQEGNNVVSLWGNYLGSYPAEQTRAELYLDGIKIKDSVETYVGGNVSFKFDYNFKAGSNYSLKVYVNNEEKTQSGGVLFKAVPRLDWDFVSVQNKTYTIQESSLTDFGWSSGDDISVMLHGPGAWNYNETKGTNLVVSDTDLTFTIAENPAQGRNFPFQEGEYYFEVMKGDVQIGFTDLIVANSDRDVLSGIVNAADHNPANGGYVDIGKEGEGWGERVPVGHNGSFHIGRNRLRGSGNYFLTAIPSETSDDASGRVFFTISNDDFSGDVTINLNTVQVTGTVKADGQIVTSGYVDLIDSSGEGKRVQSAKIGPDGSYKLGGLTNANYYLEANGPWELDYLSSNWQEVVYSGSPLENQDLNLTPAQFTGTAKDGSDLKLDLKGDQYDINIRSLNNYNSGFEMKTRDGRFIVGKLDPGTYAVAIAPRGSSVFARSNEIKVTISENGTVSPSTIALELTKPMLSGSVYDKEGTDKQFVTTDGYVEVWTDKPEGSEYIYSIPLYQGTYKAGGLEPGNYKIVASASDYTELYKTRSRSTFVKVDLNNSPITQDLYLTDRTVPRVQWVNDAQIGNDRINIRIMNYRSLDMSNLEAEIVKADGSSLNPQLQISFDKIKKTWDNYNSDEADLELYIDNKLQVAPGNYKLILTYNGVQLANDDENANAFYISYALTVQPKGVVEATPGMSLTMFVDNLQGGKVTGLWGSSDIMTVNLTANDGKKYNGLLCTKNSDDTLTITLPDTLEGGKLSDGWTLTELYKGSTLLAIGNLSVGSPVIEYADDATEGDNGVRVYGQYLAVYDNQQTVAKLLDSSDAVLWTSDRMDFRGDSLEFWFYDKKLSAGQYKLSVYSGGQWIKTLTFKVTPRLICAPHAVVQGQSAQIIVKNSSSDAAFQWGQSDLITNFMVRIGGPAHSYEIRSTNGLTFDDDRNLKLTIDGTVDGTDGQKLLSQTGNGWLEVYKNNQKIGYSEFTIGYDVVSATVKNSDGQIIPKARVRITNLNQSDNYNMEVQADSEGRFFLTKQDLPRKDDSNFSGDYSFLVMAPAGSGYVTSLFVRNIDTETSNVIELQLPLAQITGVVKAGSQNASAGMIEVQKVVGDRWEYLFDFDLDPNGSFKIGGLPDGTYYIRAREGKDDQAYVASDFTQVTVVSSTGGNINLSLNPVQISGSALDPSGGQLKGDQFYVNVRPLDEANKDCWGEARTADGTYRIGALKPGRYAISLRPNRNTPYTQSIETTITIKTDGTVDGNNIIPLKLTTPKFTGTVKAGDAAFNEGYVDVFTGSWLRPMYVTTVDLDDNGNFRIGGIDNGKYFVRAALWYESTFRNSYSQSLMTEIDLGNTTSLLLPLVGNVTPRIRYVDDAGIGDDRISIHIVNISKIESNIDRSKLQARILDLSNNVKIGPITGEDNFFIDGGYDYDKDEGNLGIRINGNVQLTAGKYKLELSYDLDNDGVYEANEVLENETPLVNGFSGFRVLYNLDVMPFAVVPEESGSKVIELGLGMEKANYPWSSTDTVEVRLYQENGTYVILEEAVATDKTLTVTLPAQNLANGFYTIEVYVNSKLLAKNGFTVGYPRVEGVNDATEEQPDIRIYGQNLIIYMDGTTTAKIYDATGDNLILTDENPDFMWGEIVVNFNDMRLAPGEYLLKLYYKNGTPVDPNGWRFKSVNILRSTPSYLLANQTSGQTITLQSPDGSTVPWNAGDTLRIHMRSDWSKGDDEYVVTPATIDVTADSVTFTFNQNLPWNGHFSININKVDGQGNEIYIGYAHFYLGAKEQLTGTILDTSGNPSPYAYVYVKKKNDDGWNAGFDADVNGKYGVYDLEAGDYTVYAAPPTGMTYMDSDGFDIKVDSNGNCIDSEGNIITVTHDFNLKVGMMISGKISLPVGVVAPAEGLKGWITAWNDNGTPDNSDDRQFGREFRIQGGANSADYSIIVSNDFSGYYVETWCEGLGLLNTSNFYSATAPAGAVNTLAEADMVNVASGSATGVNLRLRQGKAISGTVRLPSGVAPAGGIDIDISVNDDKNTDDYRDDINGGIRVTIPENQSSVSYTIIVPASGDYTVEYRIDSRYQYMENGFYQSGTVTAFDRKQAAGVDATTDRTGINMTLVSAKFIKGTITLPEDYTLPTNGISGWIGASTGMKTEDGADDYGYGTGFEITTGNATNYTIKVPAGLNNFVVEAWTGTPGLVNCGTFYNGGSGTYIMDTATDVYFTSGEKLGVNITIAKGNKISGQLSIPDTAPAGGLTFRIEVISDNKTTDNKDDDIAAAYQVSIDEGKDSGTYELYLPAGVDSTHKYQYKVKYISESSDRYMYEGYYYSATETILDYNKATPVEMISEGLAGINLTAIGARLIKGSIELPDGYVVPDSGINGWIMAHTGSATPDPSDDHGFGFPIELKKGGTIYYYTIAVPKTMNNFVVGLWTDGVGLVDCGTYYSTGGSVFSLPSASTLTFNNDDPITGIKLTLVKGNNITGTITLPDNAPIGGRSMSVLAIINNGTLSEDDDIVAEAKVLIPEGKNTATYTIDVPALNGYKVCYASDPTYNYENNGFYSSTLGTVYDFDLGTALNASSNQSGINLTVKPITNPVCSKAEVSADGTTVVLSFSKQLDLTTLTASPAGFTLKVGQTPYDIDRVELDTKGTTLTLYIKDYKIFKDHKDIKVTYDDVAGGILAYDGRKLNGFIMSVTNKSTKDYSLVTGFASGALLNKNAVINVTASGESIVIKDNGVTIATATGAASKVISDEGIHKVVISVTGRMQDTTLDFTLDTTAPVVTITSPSNLTVLKNDHNGVTPVITFSSDCVTSSRTISLNGSTLATTISSDGLTYTGAAIREAGHYVLTATAKDAAGNVKTVSSSFDIIWDNSSPVITVDGVTNGGIYESATITVSLAPDAATLSANSNQANYSYKSSLKLPNGTILTGTNEVPALSGQGSYRLEIVATNPGYTDRTSSKVVEFTIDTAAPTAAVGGVTDNAVYNYAVTPIISFTDEVASQQILMNNAMVMLRRGGLPVTYSIGDTISLDGDYLLTVSTKDSKDHTSNEVVKNFTIDKTKPVISIAGALNGATYKDQNVTLTLKTNEGSLTVTDGNNQTITLDGNGQHTFTGTTNQVVTYKLVAKAVDTAGNITEQTISFSIDRLAVNIIVNGVTEGMLVSTSPEISFTTFEGTQEKQGTTVTIDYAAFTGGRYSTPGAHTLVAKFVSGEVTYTKTLHFTIDKTVPTVSVSSVLKNDGVTSANIIAKAGDTVTVRAAVTDANGISDVNLSIGMTNVLMKYVEAGSYYEGKFIVESGNYDNLAITVSAKDKAGNSASVTYNKTLTIDNTKPLVSLVTSPASADGNNGIYRSGTMKVTLTAGTNDAIYWNLNGSTGSISGSKEFTTFNQGTNILVYHAQDQAGNVSDEKVFIFAYDSIRPANVTLTSTPDGTTSMEYIRISGTVDGEGSNTGTKVFLKRSGEIIAKVSVKSTDAFDFDNIKLAEGLNTFTLTAVDLAGNESQSAVTLTRTLDSTAPVLNVEKTDETHYTVTSNENIASQTVKFNGVVVTADNITAVPAGQTKVYHITTPSPVEGINVLNVAAVDGAGNIGTGSFTSTYIPPNTAQNDLSLNDNATMDIPDDAFDTSTQILVKTVDVNGITNYKPLGAAISFEFKDDQGDPVEPTTPLLIKNYIGAGLSGVVLMHVNASGVIDSTLTATVIMSTDDGYQATIDGMGVDDPYYVSDLGYLIFRTTNFSSYQVAQDNIAPVLAVTTSDFVINKADKTAGGMKIEGTITDSDPNVHITEVTIDGASMNISGMSADNLDESFSIALDLNDGTHEIILKASDSAGNTTTVIKTYQVDITAPSLTASAAVTQTNRDSVDISVNTGEYAEVFFNGVSKGHLNGGGIIAFNLTDNAVNTINVTAVDSFGNTTAASAINVTRDSTAPAITVTGVNNGDVYGNDVTIAVNATDPHSPDTTITMDGSSYTPGAYSTEGQHTLMVSSTDSYGNTASRTVVFTIDKSVPVINVTGAVNDGKYGTNKTLTITADNIDELVVTKATDNQAPASVNTTVDGTNGSASLSLGVAGEQHDYKVVITARKTVGGQVRSASTTITLTVDRKNPVITSTTASQTENATIDLTGTIDEAADIYLDGTKVITGNPAGSFSITGESLNLGANSFSIKAVDAVGNEASLTITVTRNQPVNNGGNNGGNPGGPIGGGITPPVDNKDDEVKPDTPKDTDNTDTEESKTVTIPEKPESKGSTATATTTATELKTAIASSEKDSDGVTTVKIEIQEIKGAKTYTEVLPVKSMKTGGADLNVEIATPLGTVTISGDIFTVKDTYRKSSIGISIATADKSKLDEATLEAIGNKPVIELSVALDGKTVSWNNPNAPVTVAIKYQPTAAELKDPDHIVVWYIDGNGKVQTVSNGRYDAETGTVTFSTTHFSKYAVAYVTKSFDDIAGLAAEKEIEVIASKGIMSGVTEDTFDPEGMVTKGDFIAYLINTLGLTAEVKANFADVKATDPNYNAIGIALELGILTGTSKSKFNPNKLITKEEMAIYTVKAMKLSQKTLKAATRRDLSKYSDASKVSGSAVNSVAKLVKSGILKITGDKINSKGNLTRAEVAQILYNIYKAE